MKKLAMVLMMSLPTVQSHAAAAKTRLVHILSAPALDASKIGEAIALVQTTHEFFESSKGRVAVEGLALLGVHSDCPNTLKVAEAYVAFMKTVNSTKEYSVKINSLNFKVAKKATNFMLYKNAMEINALPFASPESRVLCERVEKYSAFINFIREQKAQL